MSKDFASDKEFIGVTLKTLSVFGDGKKLRDKGLDVELYGAVLENNQAGRCSSLGTEQNREAAPLHCLSARREHDENGSNLDVLAATPLLQPLSGRRRRQRSVHYCHAEHFRGLG